MRRASAPIDGMVCGSSICSNFIKDLRADVAAWYFHSTHVYILVMVGASILFVLEWWKLRRDGVDVAGIV